MREILILIRHVDKSYYELAKNEIYNIDFKLLKEVNIIAYNEYLKNDYNYINLNNIEIKKNKPENSFINSNDDVWDHSSFSHNSEMIEIQDKKRALIKGKL